MGKGKASRCIGGSMARIRRSGGKLGGGCQCWKANLGKLQGNKGFDWEESRRKMAEVI